MHIYLRAADQTPPAIGLTIVRPNLLTLGNWTDIISALDIFLFDYLFLTAVFYKMLV